MKLLVIVTVNLALFSLACAPAANTSSSPTVASTASVAQPSPIGLPSIDPTKPDFQLAENLTYEELKDISERVRSECDRRKLSDLACLTLSNQRLRAASVARWKADGKKWIIRDATSPLYPK